MSVIALRLAAAAAQVLSAAEKPPELEPGLSLWPLLVILVGVFAGSGVALFRPRRRRSEE